MKFRKGFVTNSSSTSFLITNKSKEAKNFHDFIEEFKDQILFCVKSYDGMIVLPDRYKTDEKNVLSLGDEVKEKYRKDYILQPGKNIVIFGDDDGTNVGAVFDYCLRHLKDTKNFSCKVDKYLR